MLTPARFPQLKKLVFVTICIIMISINMNHYTEDNKMTAQAQTARITILSTPDFKGWITQEAKQEGVSVGELIRQRCQVKPNEEEILLATLVAEVKQATKKAEKSLAKGLSDAEKILTELRSKK